MRYIFAHLVFASLARLLRRELSESRHLSSDLREMTELGKKISGRRKEQGGASLTWPRNK